ncbi:AAA family ATPase [Methylocystis sp.]|uniref:AAA family ATPase n=1 Tax=Methylocystis sp. TaxID=1911079 RepID=UPI0025E4A6AB|nr:AAA family ATPase [Methylocystis sp.]
MSDRKENGALGKAHRQSSAASESKLPSSKELDAGASAVSHANGAPVAPAFLNLSEAVRPLTSFRNWVVWRYEPTANGGKPTKIPYQARDVKERARTNDKATWASYAEACAAYRAGGFDGIGFVLTGTRFCAFDMDGCLTRDDNGDIVIVPKARALLEGCASYVEVTPSGRGLRVIGYGHGDRVHTKQSQGEYSLEIYRKATRFITMTGDAVPGFDLQLANIDPAIERLRPPLTKVTTTTKSAAAPKGDGVVTHATDDTTYDYPRRSFAEGEDGESVDDEKTMKTIREGVEVGKRSEAFQSVVNRLYRLGFAPDDVLTLFEKYPDGIAQKYDGRLGKEVDRSWNKAVTYDAAQIEALVTKYFDDLDDDDDATASGPDELLISWLKAFRAPRSDKPRGKRVLLKCAADIKPKGYDWVWKHYLVRDKMHIIAGTKGDGKSTLAFQIATIISTGGLFPDGAQAQKGNVLIWSGEDGEDDTIVPRLMAMGADLKRIFILSEVDENGKKRPFDPGVDLENVETVVAQIDGGVALTILDPIASAVKPGTDSHKNAETRQGLQPVVDFAKKHHCAVVGVHHLTKGTRGNTPVERVTGSLAFAAIPRVVLMTATRQTVEDGQSPRVLVRAASNIGPSGGGFGYDIEETFVHDADGVAFPASRIKWGESIAGPAKALLDAAETAETSEEKRRPALAAAKTFLSDMLRDGPRLAAEIFEAAAADGHTKSTIKRAKDEMRIKSRKAASGAWDWALPDDMSEFFEE